MSVDLQHIQEVWREADLLVPEQQVESALDTLGQNITARLADKNPIVVCLMNGGLIISGKLLPRLSFPLQVDYIHATRYRDNTIGSDIHWRVEPHLGFEDRTVLIVDDILDEGHTLVEVIAFCKAKGAAEVLSAVLLDKQHDRKAVPGFKAEFTGLEVEDRYVFGYGMDYKGYLRNAAGIYAVKGM